ncbi:hypothetical protein CBF23_011930 [Marinomonas agarivorans]|nr:hypothetical protein CBF23_011930 [Marinomonas agarivorans]
MGSVAMLNNPQTKKENIYQSWIETYGGQEFSNFALQQMLTLENLLCEVPKNSHSWQKLQTIFRIATKMETAFWRQGLDSILNDQDLL